MVKRRSQWNFQLKIFVPTAQYRLPTPPAPVAVLCSSHAVFKHDLEQRRDRETHAKQATSCWQDTVQVGLPGREQCSILDHSLHNLCLKWQWPAMSTLTANHAGVASRLASDRPHKCCHPRRPIPAQCRFGAGATASAYRAECWLPLHCHERLMTGRSCLHAAGAACIACSCWLCLRHTKTALSPGWSLPLRQAPWQARSSAYPPPGAPALVLHSILHLLRALHLWDLWPAPVQSCKGALQGGRGSRCWGCALP